MTISYNPIEHLLPGLREIWKETLGDPSIKIAVIDGPVDTTHPSLASSHLEIQETHVGSDYKLGGDSIQHGTHVASIIFGHHSSEIKGIAPGCTGLILPVFKDDKNGHVQACSQVDLARTILQAAAAGANIINISGGELSPSGKADQILSKAIEFCNEQKILVVAAAGNDGCACLHVPGATPTVLAVGAMGKEGIPLEFSNWGEEYRSHGILAPGENIPGANPSGGIEEKTGTSYATPIVSGIAGLLMSIQKKNGIRPSGNIVRNILLENAIGCKKKDAVYCDRLLKGTINLHGTINEILKNNKIIMSIDQQNPKVVYSSPMIESDTEQELMDKPQVILAHYDEEKKLDTSTEIPKEEINPSGCGCGGGDTCSCSSKEKTPKTVQMVYALGTIGYDLASESARVSLAQHMNGNPNDPAQLLEYLEKNPWEAPSIIWTLKLDSTPIYAIHFQGPFAAEGYRRLQEFLLEQSTKGVDRISIAGFIAGQTQLSSGQVVPVILAQLRCMYSWNTEALVNLVSGKAPANNAKKEEKDAYEEQQLAITNFLERIYHELRNLGITPQERAINYAATNALNVAQIFAETIKDNMQLDTIEVERSAICRQGADCWDVVMCFFDPEKQMVRARKCYRFTVDVSHVCPVMVGEVRSWYVR